MRTKPTNVSRYIPILVNLPVETITVRTCDYDNCFAVMVKLEGNKKEWRIEKDNAIAFDDMVADIKSWASSL